MAQAYVSATYEDLKEHRRIASVVLRRFGYDDVSMEYFGPEEKRPIQACLAQLALCDLYVGLFAWRYGFIPERGNPRQLSITELEYWRAVELVKPRLLFVVDPRHAWKGSLGDHDDRSRMMAFHETLHKEPCRHFTSARSLEEQLTAALVSVPTAPPSPPRTVLSLEAVQRMRKLAASPEHIARFLTKVALRDRGRLALLESPTTAGFADYLRDQKVDQPAALAELMDLLDADHDFEPDPLWLAWITHIHAERLSEIGTHIVSYYSGRPE